MIISAHLDPALGEARTVAPTPANGGAKSYIATTKNWGMVTFDVTMAFLQGNPTEREIYTIFPKQMLPELPEHGLPVIPPCTLLKVLKSACGLSEASRLWFLRTRALLDTGLETLEAAPGCYRWIHHGEILAVLSLHVDEGLVVADLQREKWRQIKEQVNKTFTTKSREEITDIGAFGTWASHAYQEASS
eukprot:1359956-Amphidinium_carterae.2